MWQSKSHLRFDSGPVPANFYGDACSKARSILEHALQGLAERVAKHFEPLTVLRGSRIGNHG